jgi:hypothetical protein
LQPTILRNSSVSGRPPKQAKTMHHDASIAIRNRQAPRPGAPVARFTSLLRASPWRLLLVSLWLPAALALWCRGEDDPVPAADVILAQMRDLLPRTPLLIRGQLTTNPYGKREGVKLNVDVELDWSRQPLMARYTLRDAFGLDLESLTVIRGEGEPVQYRYMKGSPLESATLPDLHAPIQSTDVSWADLSLSYLWWKGGEVTGVARLRGQKCYVLKVPAPADAAEVGETRYAGATMWIEKSSGMLVQADAFGEGGTVVRRVIMRSLKKIDDQWMAKDIDILSLPSGDKTRFRVKEIQRVAVAGAQDGSARQDD